MFRRVLTRRCAAPMSEHPAPSGPTHKPSVTSTAPPTSNAVEASIGRSRKLVENYPMRFTAAIFGIAAAVFYYEVHIKHQGNVPSPYVNNHLEYKMDDDSDKFPGQEKRSTLHVSGGHLGARGGHWDVRNNERNWSIMAQDLQKQKDDYTYRSDRGRDDDFGRLSRK